MSEHHQSRAVQQKKNILQTASALHVLRASSAGAFHVTSRSPSIRHKAFFLSYLFQTWIGEMLKLSSFLSLITAFHRAELHNIFTSFSLTLTCPISLSHHSQLSDRLSVYTVVFSLQLLSSILSLQTNHTPKP